MGELPAWLTESEIFAAVVILLAVVVVVRISSWIVFRVRYRDGLPLVLPPLREDSPDAAGAAQADLVAELAAYIAADPSGALAPGALSRVTPPTPAEEPFTSPTGFVATIAAFAVARRPGLHVQLTRIDPADDDEWRVTLMLIQQPTGRIVASHTVEAPRAEIVAHLGSFCVHRVHSQIAFSRETPRWERWHSADGYRLYRDGLTLRTEGLQIQADAFGLQAEAHQLRREADGRQLVTPADAAAATALRRRADDLDDAVDAAHQRWTDLLQLAADRFRSASVADPANLLPLLARAALTEILGDRSTSQRLYEIARSLWPEQIESTYRLLTYDLWRRRWPGSSLTNEQASADVRRLLRPWRISWLWLRSWLPRWWSPGERAYWAAWLRPADHRTPRLTLRSKRRDLITGAEVAWLTVQLRSILAEGGNREQVRLLLLQMDRRLSRGRWRWRLRRRTAVDRLLTMRRSRFPFTRQRRGRIATRGWLAQYNAAAFYSTALSLSAPLRPPLRNDQPEWTDDAWQQACALAAVSHLAVVLRDPYNLLDPGWLRNDPDLEPLARALMEIGIDGPPYASWALYAGLIGRLPGPPRGQGDQSGAERENRPLPPTGIGGALGDLLRRLRRRRARR